jgi:hypothetical protein
VPVGPWNRRDVMSPLRSSVQECRIAFLLLSASSPRAREGSRRLLRRAALRSGTLARIERVRHRLVGVATLDRLHPIDDTAEQRSGREDGARPEGPQALPRRKGARLHRTQRVPNGRIRDLGPCADLGVAGSGEARSKASVAPVRRPAASGATGGDAPQADGARRSCSARRRAG